MKRKLWLVIAVLLLVGVYLYAEDVAWNQDSTAAGGRRQGVLIQTPIGETLPVSGELTAINTVMVSDTLFMDSMTINPYTEVTKNLTGVKTLRLQPRTGIDVRVAIGTGSSTSTTYWTVFAGSVLPINNLNGIAVTIAAMGNDAAANDTGILSIFYTK